MTEEAKAIKAEIYKLNQAEAEGIVAVGKAPVLNLCRKLIAAGHDPGSRLEAYRGSTLCLHVRRLDEGAALAVRENDQVGPIFVPYRPGPSSPEE